jgi:hypothetical protein
MLALFDPSSTLLIALVWFVGAVIGAALTIWFLWCALNRAGLPGPIALIAIIPLGFLVVLGILAFAEWPNLETRERVNATG